MTYGRNKLTAKQILTDPVLFLAFGFGSGLSSKAPGTLGTLAAIPVYIGLTYTGFWGYVFLTALISIAGIWICGYAADQLGEHDFSGIVWDEIAGFLITMAFVLPSWQSLLIGFVLFRCFDIVKPWPIKWIDNSVQGGLGIMLDDVIAGFFAAAVMLFTGI